MDRSSRVWLGTPLAALRGKVGEGSAEIEIGWLTNFDMPRDHPLPIIARVAQYLLMMVQISGAQTNFSRLSSDLSTTGEERFRKRLVDALAQDGFSVDAKDISIKKSTSGTATIDLVATKEAKILTFPIQREVTFHVETVYEPSL